MRNILAIGATLVAMALGLSSCGSALSLSVGGMTTAYVDDLYGVHDVAALAKAEQEVAAAEAAAAAEREKRIAAMVAATNASNDIDQILSDVESGGTYVATSTTESGGGVSIYNNIYVDDYSSAYARRLRGFSSLTYSLPSSYYDYRYGDAYFLTLAYDPAFYTVMVMGDQVWVEPRYITNMFGSWNNPYYYSYRYGYNPYYYGYGYSYYDPWGWNSPYWGCHYYDHYYHHYYGHHHGWYGPGYHNPHHRPGGPGGPHGGGIGGDKPRPSTSGVTHRPSYGTSGTGAYPGGGRLSYADRLGGTTTRNDGRGATHTVVGGSQSSNRGGAGGSVTRPGGSSARPGGSTTSSVRGGVRFSGDASTQSLGTKGSGTTPTVSNNKLSQSGSTSLKESLSESTLRGGSSAGSSNSSSRTSGSTRRSSTTSIGGVRSGGSSLKVTTPSSNRNSGSSSVRSSSSSSNRSSSSRVSSLSSSNRSSSSSSRSSSSFSSSSRSSFSSGSSFGGGSSSRSSRSSSSSSSRGSSRR